MEGYDEVRIQIDRLGQPIGCTVIHNVGEARELIRPLDVGPFDTPEEVLAHASRYLTVQLSLWSSGQ